MISIMAFLKGFSLLNFLKNNFLYILAVIFVVGIVYGYWKYQEKIIRDLNMKIEESEKTIKKLENENAVLKFDSQILKMANENLKNEVERKEKEFNKMINSIKKVNKIIEDSNKRIQQLERNLRDPKFKEERILLRKSKDAHMLLKKENESLKCYIENFNNKNIDCFSDIN